MRFRMPSVINNEKYNVLEKIANCKGSFGEIFKCEREDDGVVVAVKKIKRNHTCKDEINVLKELEGPRFAPYFVQLLDWGINPGSWRRQFLVLDYAPHGSLEDYIEEHGHFSTSKANYHLSRLIDGLRMLHNIGFMHRDLKPQNVLVYVSLKGHPLMKIADFGVAIEHYNGHYRRSSVGAPTVYTAPEVANDEAYGKEADVYSLGAIGFFLHYGYELPDDDDLYYDRCGYPIFEDENVGDQRRLFARMLCRDVRERLELEKIIKFTHQTGRFTIVRKNCRTCGGVH